MSKPPREIVWELLDSLGYKRLDYKHGAMPSIKGIYYAYRFYDRWDTYVYAADDEDILIVTHDHYDDEHYSEGQAIREIVGVSPTCWATDEFDIPIDDLGRLKDLLPGIEA